MIRNPLPVGKPTAIAAKGGRRKLFAALSLITHIKHWLAFSAYSRSKGYNVVTFHCRQASLYDGLPSVSHGFSSVPQRNGSVLVGG